HPSLLPPLPIPPARGGRPGGGTPIPHDRHTATCPHPTLPPPERGREQDAVSTPPLHAGKGARSFASTRPTLPEPRCVVAGGPAQRTQGGGVRGAGPPAAARSLAAPQPPT